ncbi:patatin-like phospholipase family protein [Hoeflea poritis]|uniref:Patatin-like phospholipase family protein n=1 Tax=Hoeflea poritis TaxID=2993659 RepID=A0ABT4VH24_9HYPH|nr:patatin-like phospholipase family protein [Hoeflea poritis]MDA4843994.1 patatin-like phospholipase family protein [Hoeflea poritis]
MRRLIRFITTIFGLLALAAILFVVVAYVYSRHLAEYEYELAAWPAESTFHDPLKVETAVPHRARILAIEGGGLDGLADLEVLKAIEQRSGKRIYELFDFVAGASTGAIISTLLLNPDAETGQPMTADEAIEAYEKFAGQVFTGPRHHTILTGFGMFGPMLTNKGRIETAQEVFGTARFRDFLRPAMFPAYSQRTSGLKVFRNWNREEANLYLWPLITAVTSVPTIFPAVILSGDKHGDYFYGDPGLILNAPGDVAYIHARKHLPEATEFVVVALGTTRDFSITEDIGIKGGMLQWFTPAFRLVYRGETTVSRGALEQHETFDSDIDINLTVLSPAIPPDNSAFDPSPENIANIRKAGRDFVRDNTDGIDKLIGELSGSSSKGGRL